MSTGKLPFVEEKRTAAFVKNCDTEAVDKPVIFFQQINRANCVVRLRLSKVR